MKKIFVFILILLFIFFGCVYVDYFIVKTKNTVPKISIKKVDNDKNEIYNAIFYKVWFCKEDDKILIGSYGDPDNQCSNPLEFKDGNYVNESGLIISKKDYFIMTSGGIYTNDMINIMLDKDEVTNAVYVANEYMSNQYKVVSENDDYSLIVFKKIVEKKDNYIWDYPDSLEQYYCLYNIDGKKYYSKYINEECQSEKQELKYSSKWCSLYLNSTLKYLEEDKGKFCKE